MPKLNQIKSKIKSVFVLLKPFGRIAAIIRRLIAALHVHPSQWFLATCHTSPQNPKKIFSSPWSTPLAVLPSLFSCDRVRSQVFHPSSGIDFWNINSPLCVTAFLTLKLCSLVREETSCTPSVPRISDGVLLRMRCKTKFLLAGRPGNCYTHSLTMDHLDRDSIKGYETKQFICSLHYKWHNELSWLKCSIGG